MLLYPHQGKEQEGPSLSFSVIPIPCSHWNFIMFPEAQKYGSKEQIWLEEDGDQSPLIQSFLISDSFSLRKPFCTVACHSLLALV